jgi:hypothetical protein
MSGKLRAAIVVPFAWVVLSVSACVVQAMPVIGISQSYRDAGLNFPQNPTYDPTEDVYASSNLRPLQINYARAVVAYDIAQREPGDHRRIEFENWLKRVEELGMEPFVVLGPSELHLTSDEAAYVAPFSGAYTPAVEKFLTTFGPKTAWDVHVIGAWNEPNFNDPGVPGGPKGPVHLPHSGSPGYSSKLLSEAPSGSCTSTENCGPLLAAYYWLDARNAMKAQCNAENKDPHGNQCAVVGGEFDSDGGTSALAYWNPYATSFSQEAFGGNKPQWMSFHGWADANPGTTCSTASKEKEEHCLTYQFNHWLLGLGGAWANATVWDTEAGAKIGTGEADQNSRLNLLLATSSNNRASRLYYYNFQSRAEDDSGLIEKGETNEDIETFPRTVWLTIKNRCGCTAPPGADTYGGYPTGVTEATLVGVANPGGSALSSCKFEYGTSTAYGSSAAVPSCNNGEIYPVSYFTTVSGLTSSTTYHYRYVVTNAVGMTYGVDRTFTTPAS